MGENLTLASVRYGLCRIVEPADVAVVDALFWSVVAGVLLAFAAGFLKLRRTEKLDPDTERWSRLLEFSLLVTLSGGLFYGHYYYLSKLIIPINVLLCRYAAAPEHRVPKLASLVVVYLLLTAFVIPPTITSRLLGLDTWRLYMQHALYLYGQTLLIGLLLWEYLTLLRERERTAPARVSERLVPEVGYTAS
jgi:hypothetical protein